VIADTLKVHDGDKSVLIATASASSIGQATIRLWEWKAPKKSKASKGRTWCIAGAFEWFLKAVVVMAATAYFINVIREHFPAPVPPPAEENVARLPRSGWPADVS
jgi:hypothetical protein